MCRVPCVASLIPALFFSWLQPVAGTEELSWWIPVSGIAQVDDWDKDVAVAPMTVSAPHRHRNFASAEQHLLSNEPWLRQNPARGTVLVLLGETESELRIHGSTITNGQDATSATGSGAVDTAGISSGISSGSGQVASQRGNGQKAESQQAGANTVAAQAASGSVRGAQKQPVSTRTWLSIFRYSISFAFILKALCISSNIFYQATPITTVRAFSAKGDTGDLDLAPFISCAYGGWQWCFYGLFAYLVTRKGGFLVLVYSNFVGAILGLYYVFAFQHNCKNGRMLDRATTYYYVLGTIAASQVGAICTLPPVRALFFCGLISSSWSIIGSLSLLTTVPEVWRTRNSSSLQLPLLICGEVSATLWTFCGIMLWDPWITVPNLFSISACIYAHSLCIRFPVESNASGADAANDAVDHNAEDSPVTSCYSPASFAASPNLMSRSPPPRIASPWPLTRALNHLRGQPSSSSPLMGFERQQSAPSKCEGYGAMPGTGGTGETPPW